MFNKISRILKNIISSRIGWLLVIINLAVFSFLIKEVNQTRELSRPHCVDGKPVRFALVQTSNLFLIHTLLNLPALLASTGLSELMFRNYKDPCIDYNFESYPVVYVGNLSIVLIFEFFQWILIGFLLEKLIEETRYNVS